MNEAKENSKEEITSNDLTIIQDFNNKKANAHATIFVASMFALFTFLSLATRITQKVSISAPSPIPNMCIIGLSILSYWIIWGFGLYSLGNFTYYSTLAQGAERKLVAWKKERRLIKEYENEWSKVFKIFVDFKHNENQGHIMSQIRRNNEQLSIMVYFLIGVLPFAAYIVWIFS